MQSFPLVPNSVDGEGRFEMLDSIRVGGRPIVRARQTGNFMIRPAMVFPPCRGPHPAGDRGVAAKKAPSVPRRVPDQRRATSRYMGEPTSVRCHEDIRSGVPHARMCGSTVRVQFVSFIDLIHDARCAACRIHGGRVAVGRRPARTTRSRTPCACRTRGPCDCARRVFARRRARHGSRAQAHFFTSLSRSCNR